MSAAPSTSTRERSRDRRERARAELIAAALELAESEPFAALTVERIAAGAGISRSGFYTHFADREALLEAALADVTPALEAAAERMWTREGSPSQRVRAAVSELVGMHVEHGALLGLVAEVAAYDPRIAERWRAHLGRLTEAGAAHIRAERRSGLAPPLLRPEEAAEALVLMSERTCALSLREGRRTPAELVDSLTRIWVAALYPGVIPEADLRPGNTA